MFSTTKFTEEPKSILPPISVTRALVELKTLDKRINKSINSCDVLKLKRRQDTFDVDKFTKDARASYQSVCDLIDRRNMIKLKILESNSTTKVKIGTKEYTINEVIDRKQALSYSRDLFNKLKQQHVTVNHQFETKNEETKQKLDKLLEINFGKDKGNTNTNISDISSISKAYHDTNKIEIIDPIGIEDKITKLEDEITEFEKEVDLVLSESNAKTLLQL